MAGQRQQVECVLDAALYAPLGLALTLCERLPKELRQRRQAVENRVQLARFFGELAVRYGKAEYERQQAERRMAAQPLPQLAETLPAESGPASVIEPPAPAVPAVPGAQVPSAGSLPISDYESLAAINVVQRLASLRDDEIEQIRQFETAHRARRTILAKIGQLQDADAG